MKLLFRFLPVPVVLFASVALSAATYHPIVTSQVPYAKDQIQFQSPEFRPAQAQPQATQAQAPTQPQVVAQPPGSGGTVVATSGNVQADTKISVGTLAGEVMQYAVTAFLGVIGTALTLLITKLLNGVGANITAARQEQLQKLVERGIVLAAAGARKTLDGKIPVDVKSEVVKRAIIYAKEHGETLIKSLGEKPDSSKTEEALTARAETALADPSVPVEVANAPAAPLPIASDLRQLIKDQLLDVLKEMKAGQAKVA